MAALQTAQSTQPQVTMPEIPKLITAQGLGTSAPKIGKSFIPKPEGFDGSQKKFETWWRNITLHIVGFEAAPNSHQKILIVLSTMTEGSAVAFANNFMRSHGLRLAYYSFKEFTRMLAMHFAPADIKRKAQTALAIIKQHAHESVEAFVIRFNQCVAEAQINKEHAGAWLVQLIRQAVKPEVVNYVEISQTHIVTVGPGRNDRRPRDEGLSTKILTYRRDESRRDDRRQGQVVWLTTGDSCRDFLRWMVNQGRSLSTRRPQRRAAKTSRKEERPGTKVRRRASTQKWDG